MDNIAGRAYNYEFKMHMEGIEIPFKSANVVCTPNGVEFNINVHVNKELFDLKPKTAVQIWWREWHNSRKAWRMLADGFFSGYVTGEDSTGGRAVGITCRDFRMEIRKSPAAIGWAASNELPSETSNLFSMHGIFQKIAKKKLKTGKNVGEDTIAVDGVDTRIYDNSGLMDLEIAMEMIVGTAYGEATAKEGSYNAMNFSTSEIEQEAGVKKANGGMFLDAFIRGIWMEAVGGTRVNSFMNKRLRCDKRFLVPRNYASFNFWTRNHFGLEVGTAMMGNSRFTSLEAAMMNVAGMFSTRVYSCSTPSLISLQEGSPGLEFVMDEGVRKFLKKNEKEFGAMYMLNETMLLPPLEFTAPPNCNLFFPPMYDRLNWRRDDDGDITRGYFGVIHSLTNKAGVDFGNIHFQIPNDMFGVSKDEVKVPNKRLPLTLEERYKGVNVYHGSVEYNLAADDAAKTLASAVLTDKGKQKIVEAQAKNDKIGYTPWVNKFNPSTLQSIESNKEIEAARVKAAEKGAASSRAKEVFDGAVATAYKRHAMIKYINLKYAGRVVTIDMAFNPYVMSGFPGAVLTDVDKSNTNASKTMIGMVQQVSHSIQITSGGADASTTVIMNNVRFEDEPTDLDAEGLPLYIQETDKEAAEVDITSLKFATKIGADGKPLPPYLVPEARNLVLHDETSIKYDLKETGENENGYLFAKDFLTTSAKDLSLGKDENIYVDRSYEPNRIFKFYETVFGHTSHHFMLGQHGSKWFSYNSMHEAFSKLRTDHPDLFSDYTACINFVERNVCSADAFYHGILGLSSIDRDVLPETVSYVTRSDDFLHSIIEKEYFGVSTKVFGSEDTKGLNMRGAGEFSSIREYSPITAFIKERRDAVAAYVKAATQTAAGIAYHG